MKKKNILPPTIFIVFLLLSVVFNFIFPTQKIIFPPYNYLGWFFILLGIILNIWTDMMFKKKKTTVKPFEKPSELITAGPFKVSRHPMYLGMVILLLGIAIVQGTIIGLAFPAIFMFLMEILFMSHEEKSLEETFGQDYVNYKNRVRRWL